MNLTEEQMDEMVRTMSPTEIKSLVQDHAYRAWKLAGKRGTVQAATGVGKTRIALRALHEELLLNPQALCYIVVPTETLRDTDWPAEMVEAGYGDMVDNPNIIRICWASLDKEQPYMDVDLMVLDEIHHMTPLNCGIFSRLEIKIFSIMGLTATLPSMKGQETDKDKRIIIDGIAPSIYKVTVEQAIRLTLVSDFKVTVLLFDLDDKVKYIIAGSKAKPFKTTEASQYAYLTKTLGRAMYSKFEGLKFQAIQKRTEFIRNAKSKEQLAREVMESILPNKRTLIFCGSIEQSNELCGDNVYNSQTNDSKLTAFCEGKIDYLGVVDALNEGKNVPLLDQALVIQLTSKELAIIQRIGRTIRFRQGHVGSIIVLVAKNTADEKWYRKAFENFDQSRIKEYYVKVKGDLKVVSG